MKDKFRIDHTKIGEFISTYQFSIPYFQRRYTWTKQKRQLLIDSLDNGFPIGSITLYEISKSYSIIDGVQRINTLINYFTKPSDIIDFTEYYSNINSQLDILLEEYELSTKSFKSIIKNWYTSLDQLFEFRKISSLHKSFDKVDTKKYFPLNDLVFLERVHEILLSRIEYSNLEVPLIIYYGDFDDLPLLFKNINSGTMPLSPFEMYQSIWNNYHLDRNLFLEYEKFYKFRMKLIGSEYKMNAVQEEGKYDIFKNLVALSNKICTLKNLNILFDIPLAQIDFSYNNIEIYYDRQEIGFEIFSTICAGNPNRIDSVVKNIFSNENNDANSFISTLNEIIFNSIKDVIEILYFDGINSNNLTRYHSLYILTAYVKSKYLINIKNLSIEKESRKHIFDFAYDVEKHNKEEWFINKNRQVKFFEKKISELELLENKNDIL